MINKTAITLALLAFASFAGAQDFYVSPQGDDQANGLSAQADGGSGPFRSLLRAQMAIRELKKAGQFNAPVSVHVLGGEYILTKPLEFDIRDSGFAERPISWQGEQGPVLISGGIRLTNCQPADAGRWRCPSNGLELERIKYLENNRKKGNIPGFELFVNEQRLQLARWPNHDWAHIKLPLDERSRFSVMEKLPAVARDLKDAQVHIMAGNDWFDQYVGVAALDANANSLSLSANTSYPLVSGRRFYLQNIASELDAPGEWYYDRAAASIDFIPPPGVTPTDIVVSAQSNLLQIKGANYLSFDTLSLRHSTDLAVGIDRSHHVNLNKLEINNVGSRAIEIKASNNISVNNSHIHHTGEGGILSAGGDRKTLEATNNLIHNNHIHDFGQNILTYSPAIEFTGVGSQATHNLVEQAAGTGIQITGNDHLLEKNEVHHVCEQASDCGAIYSGRDWSFRGNIIRHNSIHDISGYGMASADAANNKVSYVRPHGARGVYLDDAVSGFSVTGNLFNNAGQMAIQLGGGRDNSIENNIFVTNDYAIWLDNRWPSYNWSVNRKNLQQVPYQSAIWRGKYPKLAEPMHNESWPEGNSVQRNIIVSHKAGGLSLRYMLPAYGNSIGHNLLWADGGQFHVDYDILDRLKKAGGATWQQWLAEGIEQDSRLADPCLNISGNNATFCADSAAKQIGFFPLPGDIGLLK